MRITQFFLDSGSFDLALLTFGFSLSEFLNANINFSAEFLALIVVEILALGIVFFVALAKRLQEALAKGRQKSNFLG